jgi:uncharacterized damage-inducible protein DinB
VNARLVELAIHYWGEYLEKIEAAVAPLTEEQLWWRGRPESNSIANLLAHLHGNLSQWVLAGLGGEPFERHRDLEFAAREGASKGDLMARLRATVARCQAVVGALDREELGRERSIQSYRVDGYRALFHAVEHMGYHTGQIVLLAKLHGVALDFYPRHRGE